MPVSRLKTTWVLVLCAAVLNVHAAQPTAVKNAAATAPDKPLVTYPFSFDTLLEDARHRAQKPYNPQHNALPAGLDKLSPEQYRSIHFNPDAGIWRNEKVPFRLELLRSGYNQQGATVTVSTVEGDRAQDLVATPAMFQMGSSLPQLGRKLALPLSGFRIRSQINSSKIWDEFLVFQNASYFRAVAQHLLYGLSGTGPRGKHRGTFGRGVSGIYTLLGGAPPRRAPSPW